MNELGVTGDGQPSDDFVTIPDVPIQPASDRVSPNQVASGVTRGTQTIVGSDSSQVTFGVVPNTTRLGLAQYDQNNKIVSELGQQADASNSLKFFDSSGIGIAQFGTFPDGTTGLKVAKSGVEVSSATNSQLIFNSNQDVFKIISTGTTTIPAVTLAASRNDFDTVIIPHGLGFAPILQAYGQVQLTYGVATTSFTTVAAYWLLPYLVTPNASMSGFLPFSNIINLIIYSFVDATNIYIAHTYTTSGAGGATFPAVPVKYYLLQETAS